jgi:3-deoxy-D-manno-octulosonate 8-phosphate phosphatase (KDO 8-P phosphatase)
MSIKEIKMVIMDVDGVLTDGRIYWDCKGIETQVFDVHDGAGIIYLQRCGIQTAIISGRDPKSTLFRAKQVRITEVHLGIGHKVEALDKILKKYRLSARDVCYVGDDLLDIPIMKRVGYPVAVNNARPEVKRCARYITKRCGGNGAIRELAEKILKAQHKWNEIIMPRYENA